METFLYCLASFAGGGFLTALGFIFGFSNKISVMQNTLNTLSIAFQKHLEQPTVTCSQHLETSLTLNTTKNEILELQREIRDMKIAISHQTGDNVSRTYPIDREAMRNS